eukprot:TRINITY_DN522_c0_g2_i4.p2 TRINITY_DN522_c0_g2~~TRINITY_DN522_c0_g2_i4.p2  ORF type:complete len:257 (+),score=50.91 TRINITY_DN522_c0_g2_i4:158-928(+)
MTVVEEAVPQRANPVKGCEGYTQRVRPAAPRHGQQHQRCWSEVAALPSFHRLLPKAAHALSELAAAGADPHNSRRSVFDAMAPPPVSVRDFLVRLCKHVYCSPQVWLCTLANADRMLSRAGLIFTPLNVHRVLLAAFTVTAKYRDDVSYGNKWYAAVAGIPTAELNVLEAVCLETLGWNAHVSPQDYSYYERMLSNEWPESASEPGLTSEGEDACSHHSGDSTCWAQVVPAGGSTVVAASGSYVRLPPALCPKVAV